MARILVIDDSLSAIQHVRGVLERAGHTVETLELLVRLPEIVRNNPPDLILLDLSMPALSGVQVAKFVRRYEARPVPILLFSSRPAEELKATALELEAAGYVQKGESDESLLRTIERTIRTAPLSAPHRA